MKNEDIKNIIREAVHETLSGLGIAANEPQEMQADFLYVRKMRKGAEFMSNKIRASIITVTIPTIIYMAWESLRQMLGKGG
jgi:hypothetical protein